MALWLKLNLGVSHRGAGRLLLQSDTPTSHTLGFPSGNWLASILRLSSLNRWTSLIFEHRHCQRSLLLPPALCWKHPNHCLDLWCTVNINMQLQKMQLLGEPGRLETAVDPAPVSVPVQINITFVMTFTSWTAVSLLFEIAPFPTCGKNRIYNIFFLVRSVFLEKRCFLMC